MIKNIKIYNIPTSKLVYYRVYNASSPFTLDEINGELKRRNNVLFNSLPNYNPKTFNDDIAKWDEKYSLYNKKHKMEHLLCPKYIELNEEEIKIERRGEGLDKYFFDEERDFYTTFVGILKAIESTPVLSTLSKDKSFIDYEMYDYLHILTWSEQVLLMKMAGKVASMIQIRYQGVTEKWLSILDEPHSYSVSNMPDEAKLFYFFYNYSEEFIKYVYMIKFEKYYEDTQNLMKDITIRSLLIMLKGYFIPSTKFTSIYDEKRLKRDLKLEQSYLSSGEENTPLMQSIENLLNDNGDISVNIAHMLKKQ